MVYDVIQSLYPESTHRMKIFWKLLKKRPEPRTKNETFTNTNILCLIT